MEKKIHLLFKYLGQHCFQTRNNDKSAWWTVDLLEISQIEAINITFAEDENMPKR